MRPTHRLFDLSINICLLCGGAIVIGETITASINTFVNTPGIGQARLTDLVLSTTCKHLGCIGSGSNNTNCNNLPVARIGDIVIPLPALIGTLITGSHNVNVN